MTKIDAIYARQSVDKSDSISIESQIEYCQYETRGKPHIIFADKGYSGKNTDRPQFQKMLQAIKKGEIKRIICYKLDRCSRSILDFATLMRELEKYNIEFVSCTEKFDTSTPMGRAMLNICIVFAQLERETIQQRVYDAYHSRNIKGFYMGGRVPYGYRLVPFCLDGKKTSCYEANLSEAENIKYIFRTYARQDSSFSDIAENLNRISQRPVWTRTKISRIISNPVYVQADGNVFDYYRKSGAIIYNNYFDFIGENGCYLYKNNQNNIELVLAPHKGIVSSELWLECRNKQTALSHHIKENKIKNTYLAGKIKCMHCGYALTVAKTIRNGVNYRYLLCSISNKSRQRCSGIRGLKADQIEKVIFDEIQKKIGVYRRTIFFWENYRLEDKIAVVDILIDKISISETNMIIYWKI